MCQTPTPERRAESRQVRTRLGRASVAAVGFLVILAISLAGYEATASGAGAAIQPVPTAIAFVPVHPEIPIERATQAAFLRAAPEWRMVAPPAPADLKGDQGTEIPFESCSLPCIAPESENDAAPDTGSSPEPAPSPAPVPSPDADPSPDPDSDDVTE